VQKQLHRDPDVMRALVLLLLCVAPAWALLQCMDEGGNPVDWFVSLHSSEICCLTTLIRCRWFIYKQPRGFSFAYRDANDKITTALKINPNYVSARADPL
jgi:hypothetical protein